MPHYGAPMDRAETTTAERPAELATPPDGLAPANLPMDPASFYRARPEAHTLSLAPDSEPKHVLEQLGPPPFRKTSFPLMGFLASLYEHVAAQISGRRNE